MKYSVKKAYKRKRNLYAILAWSFLLLFLILVVILIFNISSISVVHPIVIVIGVIIMILIIFSSLLFNSISFHINRLLIEYMGDIAMKRNEHHFKHIMRLLEENKFNDAILLYRSNVSLHKRDSSYIDGYISSYMAYVINKKRFKSK